MFCLFVIYTTLHVTSHQVPLFVEPVVEIPFPDGLDHFVCGDPFRNGGDLGQVWLLVVPRVQKRQVNVQGRQLFAQQKRIFVCNSMLF